MIKQILNFEQLETVDTSGTMIDRDTVLRNFDRESPS